MKSLTLIAIALLLSSCVSPEEMQAGFGFKNRMANNVACSFDNFTWEDTGEMYARAPLLAGGGQLNWFITQCAGRDPEPLKCHYYPGEYNGPSGFFPRESLLCETENGELEDYLVLTGLIE